MTEAWDTPEEQPVFSNGINGETGAYMRQPETLQALAQQILELPLDQDEIRQNRFWLNYKGSASFGVSEAYDENALNQTGWGIIFPATIDPAIFDSLKPLLDWRSEQSEANFKLFSDGEGYRPAETAARWLARHGAGPGEVDPERVPYYLLFVGDYDVIPFAFQAQFTQYATGRLAFSRPEDYARYALSVVEAEKHQRWHARRLAFFAPSHPDDRMSQATTEGFVRPLVEYQRQKSNWETHLLLGEKATRSALGQVLGGADTPAILFAAAHGVEFPAQSPYQRPYHGSLLCQDWPGPRAMVGRLPREFYFAAEDLAPDANLWGTLAFLIASDSAGAPFGEDLSPKGNRPPTGEAFAARLPQAMLSHPNGGALAVIGSVGRIWSNGMDSGDGLSPLVGSYEEAILKILSGSTVGSAFQAFVLRYAELVTNLSDLLEDLQFGLKNPQRDLVKNWTTVNDTKNLTILGDPAVRVMAVGESEEPAAGASINLQMLLAPATVTASLT
ncbi:MAG: hypothetical protein IH586_12505, partial [Anaerolineaceae bacterium]|nr:hypothetical protein [Anaerolineaceae bacterium]